MGDDFSKAISYLKWEWLLNLNNKSIQNPTPHRLDDSKFMNKANFKN